MDNLISIGFLSWLTVRFVAAPGAESIGNFGCLVKGAPWGETLPPVLNSIRQDQAPGAPAHRACDHKLPVRANDPHRGATVFPGGSVPELSDLYNPTDHMAQVETPIVVLLLAH